MAAVPTTTSGVSPTGIGNIQVSPIAGQQSVQPIMQPAIIPPGTGGGTTTSTGTDTSGGLGSLLGSILGAGASTYGAQNAAENISKADTAAINTQTQTLGNINQLFQPQTTLGTGAMNTLGSTLGVNGQPADYSNFLNMPGYQFAVQQGTQALQRQAAASGSAYTPNTGAAIGQYVTGTAMQDYNTYVGQLQQAAGLGAQANNTLAGANLQVGGNISQLLQNSGLAQASGVSSAAGGIGQFLNSGGLNTIGNILNSGANYITGGNGGVTGAISNWLTGGVGSGTAISPSAWSSALNSSGLGSVASTDPTFASALAGDTAAQTGAGAAGGAIGNIGDLAGAGGAGVIGDLGLTGGGAAPGGIDTMALAQQGYASLGGVPGSLATADTTAGAGAGTAAAGGAPEIGAVGGAAAGLGMAAALAVAAHQHTALSGTYWDTLNQTLAKGPAGAVPWGTANILPSIQQNTQYQGAIADLANIYANSTAGNAGNSMIPASEWAILAQHGITPETLANYNNSYATAAANEPALQAANTAYGIPNYIRAGTQSK